FSDIQIKKPPAIQLSESLSTIENEDFRVVIDPARGVVTSVFDKKNNRESIASGGSGSRLEIHWEEPNGMSAWVIGKINKVEPLVGPVELKVTENSELRVTLAWDRTFQSTTLHQTVSLSPRGGPEFSLATEWKELGGSDRQ